MSVVKSDELDNVNSIKDRLSKDENLNINDSVWLNIDLGDFC